MLVPWPPRAPLHDGTQPFINRVEQFFDNSGFLEHSRHEDEQRNSGKLIIGHERESKTISLMSLESPCSAISAAPIGIISLTGQYCTPHSVNETSMLLMASRANLEPVHSIVRNENEEENRGNDVGDRFASGRKLCIEHINANVLIALICKRPSEHVLHAVH